MIFIWNEILFIPFTKRQLVPFSTSMNLRQCLYSMYSKHASYFLPSCSFSDHGLGFSFNRELLFTWHFLVVVLLYFSMCHNFINCLSKYDYKEEELQNSPANVPSGFLPKTCSTPPFSHLRFGYTRVAPLKTQHSLFHLPDTSMWILLQSP